MKKKVLARFCTGSCGTSNAASTYRLSRNCAVFGPPNGSDAVKPDETLAPIITIRSQGEFVFAAALNVTSRDSRRTSSHWNFGSGCFECNSAC
jgi:hypothetical protein